MLWMLVAAALAGTADDADEVLVEVARRVEAPCRPAADRSATSVFPARVPSQLLRTLPGLQTNHQLGQGGVVHYAWRGFDIGAGRDLAIDVEGVPLNDPSNLIQPGLVDLAFVPRVLVDSVQMCTGAPTPAGSFGTAGTASFRLGMPDVGVHLRVGGGTDGSGFASVAWRPQRWERRTWVVAEVDGGEGVQGTRSWRHLRLGAGVEGNAGQVSGQAFVLLHDGQYDIPPWLRLDDIDAGTVRYYGRYRSWQGEGSSRRLLLGGRLTRPWAWGGVKLSAWIGGRGLRLRENRTGFLLDPVHGDGEERRQASFEVGLSGSLARSWRILRDETRLEAGIDLRSVFHAQHVAAITPRFDVLRELVDRRVQHGSIAAWTRLRLGLFRHAAIVPGVHVAQVDLRVREDPDVPVADADRVIAVVAAPRLAILTSPLRAVHLWASYERGYRPPDGRNLAGARGVVPMTLVDTVQGGLDGLAFARVRVEATGFGAFSPEEELIDPVTGDVLGYAPTRRRGGEGMISVFPLPQVRLWLEASGAEAITLGTRDPLPGAQRWLTALGATAERRRIGPVLLSAGLRAWIAGPRYLPGGWQTKPRFGVDLTAKVEWQRVAFELMVDQLIPVRRADAEGWFTSRWDTTAAPSALPAHHIVAGQPATLTLAVGGRF